MNYATVVNKHMDNIIALIVVFALGWYIGSKVQFWLDQITFKHILEDLGVSNKQLIGLIHNELSMTNASTEPGDDLERVEVSLERHQGVIYAYRKDNSQFLGQGTDQESLVSSITNRMQGVRLIINEADGADLLQKNNT
jgi:hypothetical protein